jgi:hypothetical protein
LGASAAACSATVVAAGSAAVPIGGPTTGGSLALEVAHGHDGAQPMQGVELADGTQQVAGSEVGAANQEPETSVQGANKSKNKPCYYRCHKKGHVFSMCTTIISCDICESDAHVTKICPLLKADKPIAIPCGYAVENLGFYYIPHVGVQKAKSESKGALVRVLEGSITAAQLAVELERLIPGSKWEIEEKGKDTFTTTFPSAVELQRMVLWGHMETETVKGKIEFEKVTDKEIYKYEIPKAWVQFRGLPKELRDFGIIWAIGSILGVTKMFDMKFTRKYG